MSKRVLVTGGFGFIGSYVGRKLVKGGYEVGVLDLMLRPPDFKVMLERRDGWAEAPFYAEDVRKPNNVRRVFKEFRPDIVVHLAAVSSVAYAKDHVRETIDTNVLGTYNVLKAAKTVGVERFVFVSSSMVYGDFLERLDPVREDHPLEPKEIYGISKLSGERIVRTFCEGVPFVIVRPSAVYGPLDSGGRVVQRFVEEAKAGRRSEAWSPDKRRLDFTYVEDVAEGIVLAVTRPRAEYGIFNITRGEGRTVDELINIIKLHAPEWEVEVVEKGAELVRRGTLDISYACSILGYEPRWSLEDGVAEYWHDCPFSKNPGSEYFLYGPVAEVHTGDLQCY